MLLQAPSSLTLLCPPRFDLQLAQALGQSAFEKSLREKLSQENTSIRWEMGKLQQSLEVRGDPALLCCPQFWEQSHYLCN